MSDFLVLAKKEIKNLMRDKKLIFGLIIVPLIVYPALGKMMQFGFESATKETHVAIVNFDSGKYGELLIDALNATPNVSVTVISANSVDEALKKALQENQNILVVIPNNFTGNIEANKVATVQVYGVFRGVGSGMKESVSEGRINAVINVLSEEIAKLKVRELGASNPDAILHPIKAESRSYLLGRIVDVPPTVVSQALASQSYGLPLIVFLMVMITSQMSAGAIASEKENKTLETLLTLPVKRTTIVASKITGTAVMGVVAALAYMVGLKQYMASFGTETGFSLSQLGLSISPAGVLLFGLVIFLTIAFSLSLSMLLALFAEDVQSANAIVSSVILPLAFPSFILMFIDLNGLPTAGRYLLLASPFTHPVVDYRYLITRDYTALGVSIIYLALAAGLTLYVTARIFASEKILTARLSWGRKKHG
ncbi:ABC transporter permease [Thermococcus sp.]